MVLDLRRGVSVDRATYPVGPSSYKVIDELPVTPVRRIRAIHLSEQQRYEVTLLGVMLPFITLDVLDFACVPLWAALPGVSVILAAQIITVIVLADHSARSKYSKHSSR